VSSFCDADISEHVIHGDEQLEGFWQAGCVFDFDLGTDFRHIAQYAVQARVIFQHDLSRFQNPVARSFAPLRFTDGGILGHTAEVSDNL
jgi:hypothetical protein